MKHVIFFIVLFTITTQPLLGMNNKSEPADSAGDTKSATPPAIDEKEVIKHFRQCFRQISYALPRYPDDPQDLDDYLAKANAFPSILLTCIDKCFKYALEKKLEVEATIKLVEKTIKDLKFSIEHPSGKGKTALHQAAADGNVNAVKTLLLAGAKVDSRDSDPYNATPLHFAAQHGHNKICKILLEHKADVNAQGEQNRTPLHEAAQRRHENVCKMLIEHGAKRT